MNSSLIIEYQQGVCFITLNRPEKKNALDAALYRSLVAALEAADADAEVRALHLTAQGDAFCAGNDLGDFLAAEMPPWEENPARQLLHQLQALRKPLVVAVNGVAVGIGVTLLLHADLVLAADSALFMLPFVDLGLLPEGGSSALLPQMLGHRRAAELLLACEPLSAQRALEFGILNRVCPSAELADQSRTLALSLAAKPPEAMQQAKAMLRAHPGRPLGEVMDTEIRLFMDKLASREAQEILAAKAAKPGG